MDGDAFLARVRDYHEAGWRLAIINVTTVMPNAAPETPGVFEIAWGFVKDGKLETIREQIVAGDQVPSISEFFGAAFL